MLGKLPQAGPQPLRALLPPLPTPKRLHVVLLKPRQPGLTPSFSWGLRFHLRGRQGGRGSAPGPERAPRNPWICKTAAPRQAPSKGQVRWVAGPSGSEHRLARLQSVAAHYKCLLNTSKNRHECTLRKGGVAAWPFASPAPPRPPLPFPPSSLLSLSDPGLTGTVPAQEPSAPGSTDPLPPSPSRPNPRNGATAAFTTRGPLGHNRDLGTGPPVGHLRARGRL